MMLYKIKAKGKSIRGIARGTGYSRSTVRKYLRADNIHERKLILKEVQKLSHTRILPMSWLHSFLFLS
ncbi:hypothetical protein TKV_c11140 [Thermoanaerobacter kivui]|uniref:Transposase n=1 Tax=Thermoanaerobacter kivui TaxID=2325 RepID=A0A097AR49_THEKI|nr:hypothetical protein TKV_c11140 [Thermoanaerobacter kivui]